MNEPYSAIKVTEDIYWVGAIDWGIRDFHGYSTDRGTTYNAFLVMTDKVTLIDTVKAPFKDEMLSRIASVIAPDKIDYIVSNHSEMDHTGCLMETMDLVKPEKVFASAKGIEAIMAHFHHDREITQVGDGDSISLGNKTLAFVETRLLHWPDSMFSYLVEDGILFSQDGFGMHLATSQRFADEVDPGTLEYEAAKYYANILLPFAPMAKKVLDKAADLTINMIAPDHGPIWRKDVNKVVEWYIKWGEQKPTNKAVIVYDTMWESTDKMAKAIEDGLRSAGVEVKTMRMREHHRSNVVAEVLDAGALLVGSPTLNNGMFPTLAEVLTYLKGLKPRNLVGAVFGSYGWGGGALKDIAEYMKSMKVEMVADPLEVQYVPDKEALIRCRDLGIQVAAQLKERVAAK